MNSKLRRFNELFNDSGIYDKAQDIRLSDIDMYLRQVEEHLNSMETDFIEAGDLKAVQDVNLMFSQYMKAASEFYALAMLCKKNAYLFDAFDSESEPFIQK